MSTEEEEEKLTGRNCSNHFDSMEFAIVLFWH